MKNTFAKMFTVCALAGVLGCDDSSSASSNGPDENATVESSSSSICKDCDDESSSSAKKIESSAEKGVESSDDAETGKSSSSKGKGTSSSSEKSESSSSVKTDDSSSSQKNISSSSVSSSSSIKDGSSSSFDITAPCKYGDVYIEESDGEKKAYICYEDGWKRYIPNSSSSSIARSSSSRGYEPLPSPLGYNLSYGEYEDTRDGTKYATIEITNKYGPDSVPKITFTVFAQNLKYHEKITLGANEQDDDTKVEMYCYNDSVEYCNDWWGGLYQWAEMMALPYECNSKSCADRIDPDHDGFHQGICPNGWHLITKLEMLAVSYATGGSTYIEDRMSTLASEVSYSNGFGYNTSGFSFIAAGYRCFEENGDSFFDNIGGGGYYGFPRETEPVENKSMGGGISKYSTFNAANPKKYGVSVRCVKNY